MATMPEPQNEIADPFAFRAARPELCLDYANTCCWRGTDHPEESLWTAADLLGWTKASGGVSENLTAQVAGIGEADQARLFDQAITLRETIYRVFGAVAIQEIPAEADIERLNAALAVAPPRTRLIRNLGHFGWSSEVERLPDRTAPLLLASMLLAPVLWSASDLLVQGETHRIRRCANEKCLWLFVDRSKAGTRRWCDMGACGNRAKSQRHYARVKGG